MVRVIEESRRERNLRIMGEEIRRITHEILSGKDIYREGSMYVVRSGEDGERPTSTPAIISTLDRSITVYMANFLPTAMELARRYQEIGGRNFLGFLRRWTVEKSYH